MIAKVMLTEHRIVPIAGPSGAVPDTAGPDVAGAGAARRPTGTGTPVSSELASLATMTYSELHLAWHRHFRSVPPKKISRNILELAIAWKIQESAWGGLGAAANRQVAELARAMESGSNLAKARTVSCKPGARLLRNWEGVTHEVMVVEDGFVWGGKTWGSLSVIAGEITGTHWSGPRFFGLYSPRLGVLAVGRDG